MRYTYIILISFFLIMSKMIFAQKTETNVIMIESISKYGFDETVETLSEALTVKNWKLLTTHNMQETMKKNGRDVYPIKVLELCNPEIAYNILSSDTYRLLSPMLPCRLSVYQKADGKTYISRMNLPLFSEFISGDAFTSLMRAYTDAEEFILTVTE